MDLELLILQFQKKDVKAYEKLYNMYCDSISGVVNNIVKNDDVAQEITQDVFIKAWNKADSYSAKKGRFFTWILNIARNAAIDYTRSKKFKQSKQNHNSDFFVDILETSDSLDTATDTIGLKEFVTKLGDKCKAVIELLYFKGFTQKEASEELEMPIGTIKTRNRNCIGELRTMLGV
ncbi:MULTISPECIES: RNA polymerase sigma factor [unclassified Polaribacter]|jgi:RNA polymerase sigma-70 factor (ECF subfamily)|uniref:RNA polymerase sigma factor n=1 Tax=unclassified Polaribacter TaxID=196858 RepID=UPI001C4E9C54|nr:MULTISPECIES: sigma-70 family RNA polymerase sigma factor [unclassified Polaribacter]QXP65206.1 sigma-70 family RNA polymerase sigma factor [Polaribacter sp. HaHaR_3_91]QXP67701.1 sigma-70 family RNA polymerase sigma factor [Polaribacter sp. AHE13PA]QXP69860.1 sigma-70 family RNA polymerase sigma factor [Polaribacter sp. R2A056_3_33]